VACCLSVSPIEAMGEVVNWRVDDARDCLGMREERGGIVVRERITM